MEEQLQLWMVEGFLYAHDNRMLHHYEYFEELHSWLIFHHSLGEKFSQYKIHGLLHYFAKSLAGQYFYSLDDENGNIQSLEMLRHFSFVSQQFGSYSKFKELEGARRLLTFIAIATDVDDR
ncbi:hypothetical protein Tco_0204750 [Tanacetum coccineum]